MSTMHDLELFTSAVACAARAHDGQTRKSSPVPYLAHLLAVSALVIESGADWKVASAAVLHDAVEDTDLDLETITGLFGSEVADLVAACTEPGAEIRPKKIWRERKEAYLAHLDHASVEVACIVAADKVHNAESLVIDLATSGPAAFDKFNASARDTVWFYASVASRLAKRGAPEILLVRLRHAVAEIATYVRS